VNTAPVIIDTTIGETTIHFEADRSRLLFPSQCVVVKWEVEHVKAVYVYDRGRIGQDSLLTCNADTPFPIMRLDLPDDSVHEIILPVQRWYRNPLLIGLWIAIIVGTACAAYSLFGIPGALFTSTPFLFWPITQTWVEIGVDWGNHIRLQQIVLDSGNLNALPPHFLFHVLGLGVDSLIPGVNLQEADLIVVLLAFALGSVAMYWLLKSMVGDFNGSKIRQALVYIPLTLSLWCIVPLEFSIHVLQNWLATPYISMNMYNVPTHILVKPFAVLLFFGFIKWVMGSSERRWLPTLALAVFTAAATLAKPNYTMAILPALSLVLAYQFVRPLRLNRFLIIAGILIPAIAVLGWQYLRVYGPNAPATLYNPTQGASIGLAPLELHMIWWHYSVPEIVSGFVLSIIFPAVVYLAYFKTAWRNLALNMAWLIFLIGQSFAYLFIEITYQASGNMTWGGRITLFVLFAASLGFLLRQNAASLFSGKGLPRDPRFYLCLAVYVLHLLPYLQYAHIRPAW
jgi:hypothetical protein